MACGKDKEWSILICMERDTYAWIGERQQGHLKILGEQGLRAK